MIIDYWLINRTSHYHSQYQLIFILNPSNTELSWWTKTLRPTAAATAASAGVEM
jgi:hypothetical protein